MTRRFRPTHSLPERARHDGRKVRQVIVQNLQHWLEDPDLARLRGPQALATLSESERRPWQKLWDEVADTLARARRKTTPEKSSGAR